MVDLKSTFNVLMEKYESKFKSLELSIETKENGTYAVYKAVDIYGIKNKSMFKVNEHTSETEIINWVDKLAKYTFSVMKLNNWLDDLHSKFKVNYRYVISKATIEDSIVYAWDYNSIQIALSENSLELLDKYVNSLSDITEYPGYNSFADFVSNYMNNDYIRNILEVNFKENNIYYILEEHQLKKDDVINKIHKLPKKSGILSVHSVLASSTFEILCRINWIINFDTVDINISFDDNQIFSTRDMEFIRDSSILDGLLKLYKPAINDIFL